MKLILIESAIGILSNFLFKILTPSFFKVTIKSNSDLSIELLKLTSPLPVSLWKLSKLVNFPASLTMTDILRSDNVLIFISKATTKGININRLNIQTPIFFIKLIRFFHL